jgi:hypothetical protein
MSLMCWYLHLEQVLPNIKMKGKIKLIIQHFHFSLLRMSLKQIKASWQFGSKTVGKKQNFFI